MDLASAWIALNIAFGGGMEPQFEGIDLGGSVAVNAPIGRLGNLGGLLPNSYSPQALTLGPLILTDPMMGGNSPDVISHELEHVRQYEALGPGLLLAYALGGGREFEDYRGDGTMWQPDDSMKRHPVVSYTRDNGLRIFPAFLGTGGK